MEAWYRIQPFLILGWRFFTGHHMDGKRRTTGKNGKVLPRYTDYFWNRYSRPKRALWRNLVFWSLVLAGFGFVVDSSATKYAILAFLPFLGFQVFRKLVNVFTQVVRFSDSDGVTNEYRIIRPKVHARLKRLRPARFRPTLPDGGPVPPEIFRAVQAENMEDHGEPITGLRQIQLMQGDVQEMPKDSRSRTIRRNRKRKESA